MNYGLPVIVNNHGGMSESKDNAIWHITDDFTDAELIDALNTLWKNHDLRTRLGHRAQEIVRTQHAPRTCADQYAHAIEKMYQASTFNTHALTRSLAKLSREFGYSNHVKLAKDIAKSLPAKKHQRQLLLDVTDFIPDPKQLPHTIQQRLSEYLRHPPQGFRVEPIYATPDRRYCYARHFTLSFLDCPTIFFQDEPVEYKFGDRIVNLKTEVETDLLPL